MRNVGLLCPTAPDGVTPGDFARKAEALGFESLWVGEHPAIPADIERSYVQLIDGEVPYFYTNVVDPWITLSHIAGGIDGLARVCRETLLADPMSGAVYVFCNRRRTAMKLLVYDGQGFWLCHKRLSSGQFRWWPSDSGSCATVLLAHELQVLLFGGDPSATKAAPVWRRVA